MRSLPGSARPAPGNMVLPRKVTCHSQKEIEEGQGVHNYLLKPHLLSDFHPLHTERVCQWTLHPALAEARGRLCQNLQVRGFSLLPVHVAVQLLQSMLDCTFPLCNFHLFLFYDLSLSIDVFCLMQLCHPPFLYSLSTVSFSLGNTRAMAALRIQPPAAEAVSVACSWFAFPPAPVCGPRLPVS